MASSSGVGARQDVGSTQVKVEDNKLSVQWKETSNTIYYPDPKGFRTRDWEEAWKVDLSDYEYEWERVKDTESFQRMIIHCFCWATIERTRYQRTGQEEELQKQVIECIQRFDEELTNFPEESDHLYFPHYPVVQSRPEIVDWISSNLPVLPEVKPSTEEFFLHVVRVRVTEDGIKIRFQNHLCADRIDYTVLAWQRKHNWCWWIQQQMTEGFISPETWGQQDWNQDTLVLVEYDLGSEYVEVPLYNYMAQSLPTMLLQDGLLLKFDLPSIDNHFATDALPPTGGCWWGFFPATCARRIFFQLLEDARIDVAQYLLFDWFPDPRLNNSENRTVNLRADVVSYVVNRALEWSMHEMEHGQGDIQWFFSPTETVIQLPEYWVPLKPLTLSFTPIEQAEDRLTPLELIQGWMKRILALTLECFLIQTHPSARVTWKCGTNTCFRSLQDIDPQTVCNEILSMVMQEEVDLDLSVPEDVTPWVACLRFLRAMLH